MLELSTESPCKSTFFNAGVKPAQPKESDMLRNILTLVAAMALALFMVPTNSFAEDGAEAEAPRECASKLGHEYARCSQVNIAIPFRKYAERQAERAGMEVEDFIAFNKWEPFVDTIKTDPTVVYLILLPQEPLTVASR